MLSGYLPSGYDASTDQFDLIDLSGTQLSEPFYRRSVDSARARGAPEERLTVTALERRRHVEAIPIEFIVFHAGRCGSTLLANGLAALGRHLVLKEPAYLNDALRSLDDGTITRDHLSRVLAISTSPVRPGQRAAVIKCTSWNTAYGCELTEAVPTALPLFLYRDPAAVVNSQLRHHPKWSDDNLGETLMIAELLERWMAIASSALNTLPHYTVFACYPCLSEAFVDFVVGICAKVGYRVTAVQRDVLSETGRRDAKEPAHTWQASGSEVVPDAVLRAVEDAVADRLFDRLRERCALGGACRRDRGAASRRVADDVTFDSDAATIDDA